MNGHGARIRTIAHFRLASSTALFIPIELESLPAQHAGSSPCPVSSPRYRCSVHINIGDWALNTDRPLHTAPFHVGPRNLAPLSIQLDILVSRVADTHEAPGSEGESEPPLLTTPQINRAETSCGWAIRPLDKDY